MSRASNLTVKPLKNNRRGKRVNDTPERMIRRFTRKVKKAGILNEVRRRRYYRSELFVCHFGSQCRHSPKL